MNKIRTVLKFEYLGYIKSKSFIITTVIFVAIILILSQVPNFLGAFENIGDAITGGGDKKALVWLTGEAESDAAVKEALSPKVLGKATGGTYKWETYDPDKKYADFKDSDKLKITALSDDVTVSEAGDDPITMIWSGAFEIVLCYDGGKTYELYGTGQNMTLSMLPMTLDPVVTDAARAGMMEGMSDAEKARVRAVMDTTVAGEVQAIGGGDAQSNYWLAYIMLYMLFMMIMLYGQFIINSVISEKSSKMMELLVTSARPIELMAGKVFGVGLAAFTQFGAIVGAFVISFAVNYPTWKQQIPGFEDMISQLNISPGLLVFFVLFFVLGYFLYAFISAAMGSTASRVEDAGSVGTIPSMLAVGSFIVSMVSMQFIDAAYVHVLSFIPFFSPWIMFSRLCMASATFVEAAIAAGILAASMVFFGWLSAKIYRVGVMMYGKPMKLKAALAAALHS
jgi:ABC-2 type transport system permease protein